MAEKDIFKGMKPVIVIDAYKVEYLRKQRGLTQAELALAGDISPRTVGRITEAAKAGDPHIMNLNFRLSTINGFARALGTTGIALLKEIPDP